MQKGENWVKYHEVASFWVKDSKNHPARNMYVDEGGEEMVEMHNIYP